MPSENETNENESTPAAMPKPYALTAAEQAVLFNLGNVLAQRKLAIYTLNMQLELEQRARDAAEERFSGALAMLSDSRGFKRGQLSPDFSTIMEQK